MQGLISEIIDKLELSIDSDTRDNLVKLGKQHIWRIIEENKNEPYSSKEEIIKQQKLEISTPTKCRLCNPYGLNIEFEKCKNPDCKNWICKQCLLHMGSSFKCESCFGIWCLDCSREWFYGVICPKCMEIK